MQSQDIQLPQVRVEAQGTPEEHQRDHNQDIRERRVWGWLDNLVYRLFHQYESQGV